VNQNIEISASSQKMPNSFVPGRNGLFTMMAAPFACYVNAKFLYLGVMEIEGVNSGYPDCSRAYVDRVEEVIRLDYPEHRLSIRTPLIRHTKAESLSVAKSLGVLDFLLEATVSCYRGVLHPGCKECPACVLRNQGIEQFLNSDDAQRAR
jgi:7-cyano-7-deazaguanine synthase